MTTLLLSQGVPMLLAGDEMGRTQNGNNNAYCQDNEISWLNWNIDSHDREFMEFVRQVIRIRMAHPVFRRRYFFQGRRIKGSNVKDILWLRPDGEEMRDREWKLHHARCLGLLLHGDAIDEHDERGRRIRDDTYLLLLNADSRMITFRMPKQVGIARWTIEIDTCYPNGKRRNQRAFTTGQSYSLQARSTSLLRLMKQRN
jgi:glycogen operon protein